MRQIQLLDGEGLHRLQMRTGECRRPVDREVTVRIHASSLNFADYLLCSGRMPARAGHVPLAEAAGIVTDVGPGVESLRTGDSVMSTFYPRWPDGPPTDKATEIIPGITADGYGRESVTMPEYYFSRAPIGWSFAEAATLPCAGLTAWRAVVVEGKVGPGMSVLVQGTGGVSIYALRIARALGARVIATTSDERKVERLKKLGADEVINYLQRPEWGATAKEMAGGEGVDLVLDVGGANTLHQSFAAIRKAGHIVQIGLLGGSDLKLSFSDMNSKQAKLQGISVGNHKMQLAMVEAVSQLNIKPVIDRAFDLADLLAAFQYQEKQGQIGKISVTI